jgi:hypothetical protein
MQLDLFLDARDTILVNDLVAALLDGRNAFVEHEPAIDALRVVAHGLDGLHPRLHGRAHGGRVVRRPQPSSPTSRLMTPCYREGIAESEARGVVEAWP